MKGKTEDLARICKAGDFLDIRTDKYLYQYLVSTVTQNGDDSLITGRLCRCDSDDYNAYGGVGTRTFFGEWTDHMINGRPMFITDKRGLKESICTEDIEEIVLLQADNIRDKKQAVADGAKARKEFARHCVGRDKHGYVCQSIDFNTSAWYDKATKKRIDDSLDCDVLSVISDMSKKGLDGCPDTRREDARFLDPDGENDNRNISEILHSPGFRCDYVRDTEFSFSVTGGFDDGESFDENESCVVFKDTFRNCFETRHDLFETQNKLMDTLFAPGSDYESVFKDDESKQKYVDSVTNTLYNLYHGSFEYQKEDIRDTIENEGNTKIQDSFSVKQGDDFFYGRFSTRVPDDLPILGEDVNKKKNDDFELDM